MSRWYWSACFLDLLDVVGFKRTTDNRFDLALFKRCAAHRQHTGCIGVDQPAVGVYAPLARLPAAYSGIENTAATDQQQDSEAIVREHTYRHRRLLALLVLVKVELALLFLKLLEIAPVRAVLLIARGDRLGER